MIVRIEAGDRVYPDAFRELLGGNAPLCLYGLGETALLNHCFVGLICSVRCPGALILKALDAVRLLRDAGVPVMGGFHAPMERECLDLLLRGRAPVVYCAARGLTGLRLGKAARAALHEKRLLALSPFPEQVRRTDAAGAVLRNDLVAALSRVLLVPHAVSGGKVWATASACLERGQRVLTFADEANTELIASGAFPVDTDTVVSALAFPGGSDSSLQGPADGRS